jgi:membrane associated rhomboid family serine protease
MYFFYYMPVGIDAETRRFPVLTVFFASACTAAFVLYRFFPAAVDFSYLVFYPGYSHWPMAISAAFLHVGYLHLIGNLVYLLLFGWYLEDRMGTIGFLILYLGSALVGNLAQGWYNVNVLKLDTMGIIGASGAVSGILGGFLVRFHISRVRIAYWVFLPLLAYTRAGRTEVPIVFALALWVLLQLTRGLVQFEGAAATVAYLTHLAGFGFGMVWTLATGGWKEARIEAHRTRAKRYLRQGEFHGAQGELARYVAGRSDDGQAHAELARVMIQAGDDLGAKANYLKACELLLWSQERGECEEIYEQAVRRYPHFVLSRELQLDLAYGLERNLKYRLALKAYENFARSYPTHKEAPFTLLRAANLFCKTFSDPGRAKQCYKELIEKYPEDAWVDFAREQMRVLV